MPAVVDALNSLARDPQVAQAIDVARESCTQLRWHNALRKRIPQAAAESRVRGARASAALEGAELSVDVVRELLVGATAWPGEPDPLEAVAKGAVQATAESERVTPLILSSPAQAFARLHIAGAAGLVADDALGRPRQRGEAAVELGEVGPGVVADEVPARLQVIYDVVAAREQVPAPVVCAIVHAELAVVRPFVRANAVVARAAERALLKATGLDPTGVVVPEVGYLREASAGYVGALAAYATGTAEGVALWLKFSADAILRGASEGVAIADAVQAGRLTY